MDSIGLVLQGGGMRGVYTSGVLDFFMEQELHFPYIIAVSAGACNASTYLSKQKGLGKIMHMDYIHDPRYINFKNIFFKKSILGLDFILNELPNTLVPFDFDTFYQSNSKFVVVTTDCTTGKSVYFSKDDCEDIFNAIRASCSIPILAPIVEYQGMRLVDGSISDPIPIKKSITDGNKKHVVIITSEANYSKKVLYLKRLAHKVFPRHKELNNALFQSYHLFNEAITYIKRLEADNKVFVIKPSQFISIKTLERNKSKLEKCYHLGYHDAKSLYPHLNRWLQH